MRHRRHALAWIISEEKLQLGPGTDAMPAPDRWHGSRGVIHPRCGMSYIHCMIFHVFFWGVVGAIRHLFKIKEVVSFRSYSKSADIFHSGLGNEASCFQPKAVLSADVGPVEYMGPSFFGVGTPCFVGFKRRAKGRRPFHWVTSKPQSARTHIQP